MTRWAILSLGALTGAALALWLLGQLDRPLARLERGPWMFNERVGA